MRALLLVASVASLLPATVAAQVPSSLSYQGRLTSSSGVPQAGIVDMQFAIFDAATGGNEIWCERQPAIALTDGYYSVFLGEGMACASQSTGSLASAFGAANRYLELSVRGSPLSPRQRIASVPFAQVAGSLAGAPGLDLFNAAMQGTYPLVVSAMRGSPFFCGPAPVSFSLGGHASFGQILFTNEGDFSQLHYSPFTIGTSCSDANSICTGPFTYFLKNPGLARSIAIHAQLDNGDSFLYVNGNDSAGGQFAFRSSPVAGNTKTAVQISIPAGDFALSIIGCSSDGPTNIVAVTDKFITANGLKVDYDRTFHRNGK